jgi:hypothetical protein
VSYCVPNAPDQGALRARCRFARVRTGTPLTWTGRVTSADGRHVAGARSRSSTLTPTASTLAHSDSAAAPVDRLAQRKTLVVGRCPQRLPSALSVSDESIAFTKGGPHNNCRSFWSDRSLRSAAWALTLSAAPLVLQTADASHLRSSLTISTCFTYPPSRFKIRCASGVQRSNRSQVRYTYCTDGMYPGWRDRRGGRNCLSGV